MIIFVQAILIAALEWGLQSWIWVAAVPLAFGLATHASPAIMTGRGAAAGALSWLGASLYFYLASGSIIANRMATMFRLGRGRGWLMVIVTGIAGAIIAGLAAFTGASIRDAIKPKK